MVSTSSDERVTTPAVVAAVNTNDAPLSPATRKRPCCKKCSKPMLGHKRGQCEAESTPTKIKVEDEDKPKVGSLDAQLATLCISKSHGGEEIEGDNKGDDVDGRRHFSVGLLKRPKATLASLTSNDKALLENLGEPGMMSRNIIIDESTSRAKIEHWLESVPVSELPKRSRQKRPSGPPIEPSRDFDAMLDLPQQRRECRTTEEHSLAMSAKPLGRTSSAAEREKFFDQLAQKSKKSVAGVFTVEMKDIQALEEHAKRLKFHARVIAPKYADGSTGMGWLVVGKEEDGVKKMFSDVEKDVKSGHGYMTTLGTIATGIVVAWTYLAFS